MKKFMKILGMTAITLAVLVFAGCSSPSSDSGDCPLVNELNEKSGGNVTGMPNKGDFFGMVFDELKDTMTKFKDVEEAIKSGSVVAGGPRLTGDSFYLTKYEGIYPTSVVWEGSGDHYMLITRVDETAPSPYMVMNMIDRAESAGGTGKEYYLSKNKITFANGKCTAAWDDFSRLVITPEDEIVLTNPIAADLTLGTGEIKNYVFNGTTLNVNAATLTVLPGVTIRFANTSGNLSVNAGSLIIMEGTEENPVILKGTGSGSGTWGGISLNNTQAANSFKHVQILNAGGVYGDAGASVGRAALFLFKARLGMNNCLIDNSQMNGISVYNASGSATDLAVITEFKGNIIRNCVGSPILVDNYTSPYNLRYISNENPFHEWTGNGRNYIPVVDMTNSRMYADFTMPSLCSLNPDGATYTAIPWYFQVDFYIGSGYDITLTIEPGADIILGPGRSIVLNIWGTSRLIAEGTAEKPITIRNFPGGSAWNRIYINPSTPSFRSRIIHCNISGGGSGGQGLVTMGDIYNHNLYLDLDNTKFSNSVNYGLRLYTRYGGVRGITSANPASVTFDNCPSGNIFYMSNLGEAYDKTYSTLSAYLADFP